MSETIARRNSKTYALTVSRNRPMGSYGLAPAAASASCKDLSPASHGTSRSQPLSTASPAGCPMTSVLTCFLPYQTILGSHVFCMLFCLRSSSIQTCRKYTNNYLNINELFLENPFMGKRTSPPCRMSTRISLSIRKTDDTTYPQNIRGTEDKFFR